MNLNGGWETLKGVRQTFGWDYVYAKTPESTSDQPPTNLSTLKHEWASSEKSVERLKELAKAHGMLSGKWMIFPTVGELAETWRTVVEAVLAGKLGSVAKVKPPMFMRPDEPSSVICVYTPNFLDAQDLTRVRSALRELGFIQRLSYKPDIYTALDIYARNAWGLPASWRNE